MTLSPPPLRHRLILKIMVIFWLTTIAVIVANIYITKEIVVTEYKTDQLRDKLRDLSKEAVFIYESEGKIALKRWYQDLSDEEELRVVLLDDQQRPIAKLKRRKHKEHDKNDHRDDSEDSEDSDGHYDSDQQVTSSDSQWNNSSNEAKDERAIERKPRRFGLDQHMLTFADQNIVSASGESYTLRVLPSPYLRSTFNPESLHLYRLGASFLIILLGSWWLARSVSKPVDSLRKASTEIADGNFQVRVSKHLGGRKDELGQLGQSFDHMASKIESLIGSQKQLFRDISHEIRTPLTRQKIAIELARDSAKTEPMLLKIEQQNQVIEDLIENLLTLMQLEDNKVKETTALDLSDVIHAVIGDAELNLNAKHLMLEEALANHLPSKGDSRLLARALENLLINAIKFSPEHSTIFITGKISGDQIVITVSDEGPGIPEQELSNIMDAFYRADKSRHNSTGGFGLGLAITDKIIKQHGGGLHLENKTPCGLNATITLPGFS